MSFQSKYFCYYKIKYENSKKKSSDNLNGLKIISYISNFSGF